MRILFDQGTPAPLRCHLDGHVVVTAAERGQSDLDKRDLIDSAEQAGYDVLITSYQNLRYQQNLARRRLAVVVLLSTAWPRVQLRVEDIRTALDQIGPGELREVPI